MSLFSRSSFAAALNLAGRAARVFGRPAAMEGREAQGTTLGFAIAGVATLHGEPDGLTSAKSFDLPEMPEPCLPTSIDYLTQTKSRVPSASLLTDLQWDALLSGPLMQQEEYSSMKSDIMQTHQRLQSLCKKGASLAADSCVDLFKRFNSWLGAHAVAVTLQSSPQGQEAISGALNASNGELEMLQQRAIKIQALLQADRLDDAMAQAKRAIRACERLGHLLRMTRVLLSKARKEAAERFNKCLAITGGVFVVALGADYLGYLPGVTSTSSEAINLVKDLAVSGTLLMLGATAANWLVSQEASQLMQRLEEAQLARVASQNNFENRLDKILDLMDDCDLSGLQDALQPHNQ